MATARLHRRPISALLLHATPASGRLFGSLLLAWTLASAAAAEPPGGPAPRPPVAAEAVPGPRDEASLELAPFEDRTFIEARRSGKPVVLVFEADWCAPCKKMHAETFRAPAVLEAAAGTRFFRVDMTTPDAYIDLVQKSFHVTGAPTVIFFGSDGKERQRRFGFISPETFAEMLSEGRKPPSQSTQTKP